MELTNIFWNTFYAHTKNRAQVVQYYSGIYESLFEIMDLSFDSTDKSVLSETLNHWFGNYWYPDEKKEWWFHDTHKDFRSGEVYRSVFVETYAPEFGITNEEIGGKLDHILYQIIAGDKWNFLHSVLDDTFKAYLKLK